MDTQEKEGVWGLQLEMFLSTCLLNWLWCYQCHIVPLKAAKGIWGPTLKRIFTIIYIARECPFANIIRKLQSLIFDIEKTITRYQMTKIQRNRQASGFVAGHQMYLKHNPLISHFKLWQECYENLYSYVVIDDDLLLLHYSVDPICLWGNQCPASASDITRLLLNP